MDQVWHVSYHCEHKRLSVWCQEGVGGGESERKRILPDGYR